MPDYAVRISYSYDMAAQLVSAWALRATHMAVYEHVGSQTQKIHIHLVIRGTNVDKKQLRNIGAKFLNLKGNELCSFKDFTGDEKYMTYMTKGIHEPKYLLGYTKEDHNKWIGDWVQQPAAGPKLDKNTKRYNEFVSSQCAMIDDEPCEAAKLFEVKRLAKYYVRTMLGLCLSIDAINVYKMLVRTYCYDNEISIPKGDKLEW